MLSRNLSFYCLVLLLFGLPFAGIGQTGSPHEPVRYIGGNSIDPDKHEGRLRYAIGVDSRQTLRVNRTNPEWADDFGWTYNHASNLAYWEGKFYQQYLSNPVDEHIAPGQTLMTTSTDGRNWSKPEVIFPPYQPPAGIKIPEGYDGYMMHQRMGFFTSNNGKLLTIAFYGHTEDPFEKGGIGRVVREVKKDGSYGPIYFIRYNSHTDWNASNTSFPFYKTAGDKAFVAACEELLSDTLITLQWRDEDNGLDGFYSGERGGEAFSYYSRKDGKIVGFWKRSVTALSDDGGKHFSKFVKAPTLTMAGGKVWGQQTEDDRYALIYNPVDIDEYRYPLIVISSDDGVIFDDMVLVQGEVPPRRFYGRWKDFGPCYVRGIVKGNGNPPGDDMWLTYSMNKEDMWVSKVPTPIRYTANGPVADDFNQLVENGAIPNWNIYSPKWAPVNVVNLTGEHGMALQLSDEDPYDYARAIRVFETSQDVTISWDFMVPAANKGTLEMDITDQFGNRPIRLKLTPSGNLTYLSGNEEVNLGEVTLNKWNSVKLDIHASIYGQFDFYWNGKLVGKALPLTEAVKSVERISFRTGEYRDLPNRKTPNEDIEPPLPGTDTKEPLGRFFVDNVSVQPK
ncbi:hypothetical protein [uncultured Cyclobacterium sp.]|uniref:hypothetical protein n=1 Tax=uncultured Cyclobacterium sp. TaxID=453820 RepID=UPI0030EF04D0|tara:strand:- start:46690 stop:48552 length:1863 start_codon:yes stop_codon:yes gene_type:complete